MATKEKDCYSTKKNTEKEVLHPKIFTTHPKKGKRRRNKKILNYEDSVAKSSLFPIEKIFGLNGLFDGEMTHFSFDIPLALRKVFVDELKHNGDSGCKILVKTVVSYVVVSKLRRQSFGDTLSKVLDVGFVIPNLNFEQNVQSRPRRYLRAGSAAAVDDNRVTCGYRDCNSEAIATGVFQKQKEFMLCEVHLKQAQSDSHNWQGLTLLKEKKP
jgi:hypothetical protein